MTNRFVRTYDKIRSRLGGRRKLALAIIGIWIAAELIAAAAVAVAGTQWLNSERGSGSAKGGSLSMSLGPSRSGPSVAVF